MYLLLWTFILNICKRFHIITPWSWYKMLFTLSLQFLSKWYSFTSALYCCQKGSRSRASFTPFQTFRLLWESLLTIKSYLIFVQNFCFSTLYSPGPGPLLIKASNLLLVVKPLFRGLGCWDSITSYDPGPGTWIVSLAIGSNLL
jgi:hypothetical protein